jgi:bifunctional non-homologous end joining protein LigD
VPDTADIGKMRKPRPAQTRLSSCWMARRLAAYETKRDFAKTPEPTRRETTATTGHGKTPAPTGRRRSARGGERARFVVHEHHARRLHWDLRLERDDALMSWAIPHGIPQDPAHNRLAVHVEDHPLSYIDFAGEIPQGSYGAGKVLIWDSGYYEPEKLKDDELIVVFHGQRLQGRYALFRTRGEDWMIHRMDPPPDGREEMPAHLVPMLATPTTTVPSRPREWAFEVKWDGIRAIAYWQPGRLRIESRRLNDITAAYPELRALGRELGAREAVLDGEIVALDEQGRPSFGRLQQRMHLTSEAAVRRRAREAPVTYVLFDLLYLDGRSTMELPYRDRRALLAELDLNGPAWRTPAHQVGKGRELLAASAEHGLEGIVAKRLRSLYRPGQRTEEWLKVKNVNRQELVIGGWLPGKGRRADTLGSLLMGYYEPRNGARVLRFAGGVGSGFDERELKRLQRELRERARKTSPFTGVQPPRGARFVRPELVAEIEFSGWTDDRMLRHGVFKGQREDRTPEDVVLETPALDVEAPNGGHRRQMEERSTSSRKNPRARKSPPAGTASSKESLPYTEDLPYEVTRKARRAAEVQVQGRTLKLSNRDKVLYPRAGFTKGELIDYYARVAPLLLPHLRDRPLTLKRYPDGVEAEYFYEKRCPAHRPDWVRTAAVWSEQHSEEIDYCLANDLPTLMWVANLASIELHTSLAYARDVRTPTALVFDLDPGEGAGPKQCCEVALWLRELFDALELTTLVKTSGAKGLQVYAPLNTPVGYEQTKLFARAVAELLERQHPQQVISRMTRHARAGRVLIDWSQNSEHKTTVCVYSPRAGERPTISTPLDWEEVQAARKSRRRNLRLSAEPAELLTRVREHGDLFAPMLDLEQTLPDL